MKKYIKFVLLLVIITESFALDGWNSAVSELLPSFTGYPQLSYVVGITSPGAKAGEDLIVNYDKDEYLLNDHCNDIVDATGTNFKEGVFRVTSISESLYRTDQE